MSLPYFKQFGWEPTVICVDEKFVQGFRDPLLNFTIPNDIKIYKVKALPFNITKKLGVGSISLRSFPYFKKKGNEILRKEKFDLIYFSTTAFHVCWLGVYWKKKFNVPFIIDVQDPWRNDYYLDKPRSERPPKFFISYKIDKYLESKTIPKADGIISVSEKYCEIFMQRYPQMRAVQFKVIAFGASYLDLETMEKFVKTSQHIKFCNDKFNAVYIGRGGYDMHFAMEIIFKAFKLGLKDLPEVFDKVHFSFVGTDYASGGKKTIEPLAQKLQIAEYVTEVTDRIPFFEALFLLKKADMLIVPGSIDDAYTASKIYPYILAERPLIAVFNKNSSVINVLKNVGYGNSIIQFDNAGSADEYINECCTKFHEILSNSNSNIHLDKNTFEPYSAKARTKSQTDFFDAVINQNIDIPAC